MALVAAARDLAAQEVPQARVLPLREEFAQQAEQSRFRLGPLRLLPTLRFENLGWTNNVLGTDPATPDYIATVVGGARFIVPLGTDVYLRGDVLPAYYWYAHLVERRTFGGRYGAELGAMRGRFTLLAGGRYEQGTTFASLEVLEPVKVSNVTGRIALEYALFRRLSIVASAGGSKGRYHPTADATQEFTLLDNDERAVRGGLKYRFRDRFDISAQVEWTRTTFPNEGEFRDNETTAILGSVGYDRERLYVNIAAGHRDGRPFGGSAFPEYSGPTGSFFVSYFLVHPLELQGYGHQGIVSSLYAANPYYVETLVGASLNVHLGHRIILTGLYEWSKLRYPNAVDEFSEARRDRGRTLGGGFTLQIVRTVALVTRMTKTDFTSNVPGSDRSILTISSTLAYDFFQPRAAQ